MRHYLKKIDTSTSPRYDVTPLFGDPEAFEALLNDLLAQLDGIAFDVVCGIDALGFVLGSAMAVRANKGFVPLRKKGKLPSRKVSCGFVDYTGLQKSLELRSDALAPGTRVLLVDEWIETGAQVTAAAKLIEQLSAVVVAVATINCDCNEKTLLLRSKYHIVSVMDSE